MFSRSAAPAALRRPSLAAMPTPRPTPRPFALPLAAVLVPVLASVLTACGGAAGPDADSIPTSAPSSAPSSAATTAASEATAAPAARSDICDLLTDAEVSGVLGSTAPISIAPATTGALDAPDGGQCVWTDGAGGVIGEGASSQLELVVYRGQLALPPPEAPSPGSDAVVDSGTGAYFAGPDAVLWLRVTGTRQSDAAAVRAALALVPVVKGRL